MKNSEVLLTGSSREVSSGLYINEDAQRSERSLIFELGNGAAEIVGKPEGNFGLCLVTVDQEGVYYGCWFEGIPDSPLTTVLDKEKDEQILLNVIFGQAVLEDHRFLPKYRIQSAINIERAICQENRGDLSRDQRELAWYFNHIDMSKQIGRLTVELAHRLAEQASVVGQYLDITQQSSLEVLLEAISQVTQGNYQESSSGFDSDLMNRHSLFRVNDR